MHERAHLIDHRAVALGPEAPLMPVHRTKVAVFIGPFVPDGHAVVVQILDVRIAVQEPQQLVDHALHVNTLGRDDRKPLRQIETQLTAKRADRPRAGPVHLASAAFENVFEQFLVLDHEEDRS
jgi:hypothetical protein